MPHHQAFIGRSCELAQLHERLEDARIGKGSVVLISGEPGIGKTRLLEELREQAVEIRMDVLAGAAASTSIEPFLIFSKALKGIASRPFFEELEQSSFSQLFAMDASGSLLMKTASNADGPDAGMLAQMLSTVQDFVKDSFQQSGGDGTSLGRMEFGEMKMLIEHGEHIVLAAIFSGIEHPDMKSSLTKVIRQIECDPSLENGNWRWDKDMENCAQAWLTQLLNNKFLVKRNLEGLRLEMERNRIADDVFTALASRSRDRPLLILLEDLHWADESSLFILRFLARNISHQSIAIVCTARSGESPAFKRTVEAMKEEDTIAEMQLTHFDDSSVAQLVQAAFSPNTFSANFIEGLTVKCGGNPFFIAELLRHMLVEGKIVETSGKFTLANEDFSVPSTIGEMIDRRLGTLDAETMAMAEYTSCIGKEFGKDAACSIGSVKEPAKSIEKLCDAGILLQVGGAMRFSHALFQDALYSGLSAKWRQLHHRCIGEYYEKTFSMNPDSAIYELARHFSQTTEHTKAFNYCLNAGLKSERSFAAEQAITFYEKALGFHPAANIDDSQTNKALELLERLGDLHTLVGSFDESLLKYEVAARTASSPEEKARMLRKTGRAYIGKGDYTKSLEWLKEAEYALNDAVTPELGRVFVQQGSAYWKLGEYDNAMKKADAAMKAFEMFESTDQDRAMVLHLVGTIHTNWGDYEKAIDYYSKSLEFAEKAGYMSGASATLNNIGIVYNNKGELDKSLDFHRRSLEIKERMGDKSGMAYSLNNIGVVFLDRGETEKALKQFEPALEIWQRVGDKLGIATGLYNIGNSYSDMGDFRKTLEYANRSLEQREKLHDKRGVGLTYSLISSAHLFMGDTEKGLEYAERSLRIREELGDKKGIAGSLSNIGIAWSDLGDIDKALANLTRSFEVYRSIGDRNGTMHGFCNLAEAHLSGGRVQEAIDNADQGVRIAMELNLKGGEGSARRILGTAHLENRDIEKASEELSKAWLLLEGTNSRIEIAKIQFARGIHWKASGQTEKAREALARAVSEFESMGMRRWVEKARKELDAL